MLIITVATDKSGYYDALVKSCQNQGIKLITLGFNMKWKGLLMKYELLKEYLVNISEDEIIMFVDAYDVIILENEETILNKFQKFNKKIVFGMHKNIILKKLLTNCNNYILNSGSYIGYVKYIRILLNILTTTLLKQKINCDQEILNRICASKRHNSFFNKYIAPDTNQILFYITDVTYYFDYKYLIYGDIGLKKDKGKLINDGIKPSVIHFAGGIDAKKILKYLKLYTKNTKNLKTTSKGISFKIQQFIDVTKVDNNLYYIIIFIILFIFIFYFIFYYKI